MCLPVGFHLLTFTCFFVSLTFLFFSALFSFSSSTVSSPRRAVAHGTSSPTLHLWSGPPSFCTHPALFHLFSSTITSSSCPRRSKCYKPKRKSQCKTNTAPSQQKKLSFPPLLLFFRRPVSDTFSSFFSPSVFFCFSSYQRCAPFREVLITLRFVRAGRIFRSAGCRFSFSCIGLF